MSRTQRKETIDFALGMLFLGGSLSFNLVEAEVFRQFVALLDPTYVIPCRQTLSKTIIDKVKQKIQEAVKPERDGVEGTLMIDGWKNTSNNTKTVTLVVKPMNGNEIFLKSYDFSTLSEDHENLLEVVRDGVTIAEQLYNIKVSSYVSDNAANMVKTGRESNLISYGCKAHVGNLYVNDVFDREIFSEVHEITVQFRNTKLQQIIRNKGGNSIYLANDTRWKVVWSKIYILRSLSSIFLRVCETS